jgi:hypothetical protein
MLRTGNRFHFVPLRRSMSPIIARHSYWFVFRSSRRRALPPRPWLGRLSGPFLAAWRCITADLLCGSLALRSASHGAAAGEAGKSAPELF